MREGPSSLPDPFYSFAPGLKHLSQRKEGEAEGSVLERALYMTGPHGLSDFEISETIKSLILTPQGRGWKCGIWTHSFKARIDR